MDEGRDPLNEIVTRCFPTLENLVERILQTGEASAIPLLVVAFKCFYIANQLELCKYYTDDKNTEKFFGFIKNVLDQELRKINN
jgi:hypothetical protein